MTSADIMQQSLVVRQATFSDNTKPASLTQTHRHTSNADLDALVPDHQVVKLYYSLLR